MANEIIFFDTLRQGLWVALIISVPILTVALLAGVRFSAPFVTSTDVVSAVTAAACLRAQNEHVHRAASLSPRGKVALSCTAPQWQVACTSIRPLTAFIVF